MKLHVEKQKNNRIFIALYSLYDTTNEKVQNCIEEIINIFSCKFYVRLETQNIDVIDKIKEEITNDILIDKKNKNIKMSFIIKSDDLSKILSFVDLDETLIELFVDYEDNNLERLKSKKEEDFIFFLYLSDNDGPFIIFDKRNYDFKNTISKIKSIIN